ncbi:hypothetical protein FDA94_23790 [Herbidospora galbida]|uniref:Uncharacterized protein n=1 Tax=Herbidospora galbida TaxID=2575442 RepID=A0A4U3MBY8_9ACTN|nr:hypothetical protein [Herbidospora galbida]TKK85922.1 hypothetical protein FDA94_23790 [Herbidospora galbida]
MRTIGKLLAGTILAGVVATGVAVAPAASASAATTVSAAQAGSSWDRFERGDGRFDYRWGKSGGRYWLDFKIWDRDRDDRDYSFFDVYYKNDGKWFFYKRYSSKSFLSKHIVFGKHVDDFRVRGGYGHGNKFGWGGWHFR